MIAAFGAVAPLLLGMAILVLGDGALSTAIPLLMQKSGLPVSATGIVMACFFAGCIVGPFFSSRLITAIGHIRTFATFVSLGSATILAHPFMDSVISWATLRFVYGFCAISIYVVVESWLNERATNDIRGRVLSIYVIVIFLFKGLGQFLVNIPDAGGTALFALISALISLAAIPVLAARVEPPKVPDTSRLSFRKLYRASPLGTLGIVGSGVIFGSAFSLGPVYAHQLGLDVAHVSLFMSALFIGGLILQWPAGLISDRIGRRPIILVLGVGVAVVSGALAVLPKGVDPIVPIGLAVLFGAVYFVIYPMCIAIINDRLESDELVQASSGLLVLNNIGSAAGPLVAGFIAARYGGNTVFMLCALGGGAIAAVAAWRTTRRPAVIPDELDAFQAVPALTPVASELDPRADSGGR